MGFERFTPYILIAPALLYMGIFIGIPILESVYIAFFEQGAFTLSSIDRLLTSSNYVEAFKFTLLLAGVIISVEVLLAVIIAVFLYYAFPGRDALVYIVIVPLAISDVAAGLIWYSILTGNGFINKLLLNAGVIDSPIQFLGYTVRHLEFLAIVLAEIWRSMAIVFVITFAGLQQVSREIIEAAEVFGAGFWAKLRHVIIPSIKPPLQSALIIRTLFAFQIFGVVWVLAGRDIPVLAGEAYYELRILFREDIAALYALTIAAVSIAFGYFYLRLLRARHLEV